MKLVSGDYGGNSFVVENKLICKTDERIITVYIEEASIKNIELVADNSKTEVMNKSNSGVKQAIIGGVLLGAAGFAIGALHGRKNEVSTKTTESYLVSIVFKNNKGVVVECNKYEYANFITLKNKLRPIDEFVEVEEIAELTEEEKERNMKLKELWQNKKMAEKQKRQEQKKEEEHFKTVFGMSYLFCFFITLILTIVKAINDVNYDFFPNFFGMIILPDVFLAGLIAIILCSLGV